MTTKQKSCEVCNQHVSVYSSRGGTNSYNAEAEKMASKLHTFINRISPAWLPEEVREDRLSLLKEFREVGGEYAR